MSPKAAYYWPLMKWPGIVFGTFAIALCGVVVYDVYSSKPPRESKVIQNFYAHRATYERLRDMLLEDKQLRRVASWGVETTKGVPAGPPSQVGYPLNRYKEYLRLLEEAGGIGGYRFEGEPPQVVGIDVFASGWAGDTRHLDICWLSREPANQVASLDEFYKTPKPRHPVYRRIEGNWYLWADW